MKRFLPFLAGGALLALAAASFIPSSQAQAEIDGSFASLVDEIAAQQAAIVEHQTRIDEKIALIAEEVRLARLHVARGGGNLKSGQ
jgi:hypothetical protein